jgi:carbamoyltransferase
VYVLGVNGGAATFHDPSACVIDGDGRVLAFLEEERLTRVRHAPGALPVQAVRECLSLAALHTSDIDVVTVGWDLPRMSARWGTQWKFPHAREFLDSIGLELSQRLPDLQFVQHHRAHAASAFHASGYERAAVLVVDGNGEDESISIFSAERGRPMVRLHCWPRVHSLGYLYEEVSDWLGLGRLNAGKTMGLAAYGRSSAAAVPNWLVPEDGDLTNVLGSDPMLGYRMLMPKWRQVITEYAAGSVPTPSSDRLDADPIAVRVAWAAQAQVETTMAWLAETARRLTGFSQLCIAGGVGLNCAANGRLPGEVFVPPVPHDAGVAIGAAWTICAPTTPTLFSAYCGGEPGQLPKQARPAAAVSSLEVDRVADLLLDGAVGAVCRGRSEVGPRALCHRSILASPVTAEMARTVNRMKDREPWRPFGPVTNNDMGEASPWWQTTNQLQRYMVGASAITDRGQRELPAVAHVDGTTRPQRLSHDDEPFVDTLLTTLARSGHPQALLNTSLNGRGEPLIETATEAVACAMRIGLDFLILNDDLLLLTDRARRQRTMR